MKDDAYANVSGSNIELRDPRRSPSNRPCQSVDCWEPLPGLLHAAVGLSPFLTHLDQYLGRVPATLLHLVAFGGARREAGKGDERGWYEDHLAHGHFLQKSWGAVGRVGVENQFHFPLLQGGRTASCPVLLNRPRGRGLGEHTGHGGGLDAGASRKWFYQPDSTFLPMPLDKRRSAQGEHACERETKPKTGFWQKWQRENDNHG